MYMLNKTDVNKLISITPIDYISDKNKNLSFEFSNLNKFHNFCGTLRFFILYIYIYIQ